MQDIVRISHENKNYLCYTVGLLMKNFIDPCIQIQADMFVLIIYCLVPSNGGM